VSKLAEYLWRSGAAAPSAAADPRWAFPSHALAQARVPGESGLPLLGHTLGFLFSSQATMDGLRERHGPDFRMQVLGNPVYIVGHPASVREVMLDKTKTFSSELGWGPAIGQLFPRGLMLLDFDEHRHDRRIMQTAFRPEAMRGYVDMMHAPIVDALASWPHSLRLYPHLKQLTLNMACGIFLGIPLGAESVRLNRAFSDVVAASIAVVKREVPGLSFARGMRGRRWLESFFHKLVKERPVRPGNDLLSELCKAKSDDGERFDDSAIVDHMIFLLMAAHDTTTSSLSSVVHCLLENPEWQDRARRDVLARGTAPWAWDQRDALPLLDGIFDEALRLYPPAPYIARRNVRDCTVGGAQIPANSAMAVSSLVTHRMPEYWKDPARFDPERFAAPRAEHSAHTHVYYPFGGGPHTCIGMHFARVQVKAILSQLLGRFRILAPGPLPQQRFAAVPIARPRDGLPVILEAL
jgi:cytochrome P450